MGGMEFRQKCKICGELHSGPICTKSVDAVISTTMSKRVVIDVPQGYEGKVSIAPDSMIEEVVINDVNGTRIVKRGRPTTGFDKKAYDRQKAAAKRAAKKAAK